MIDAKQIKLTCDLPGLDVQGCQNLCDVLAAIVTLINSGEGTALSVTLDPIDRNAPLANTVATSVACAPLGDYSWTVTNLATNISYTFSGAAGVDASAESAVAAGTYDLPLIDWVACGGALCNYRVTLTITDGCNRFATDVELLLLPNGTLYRQVFTFTAADQVVTVPTCATKARVKCWGAGGQSQSYLATHAAGAGGYTEALIPVTPGDILRVVVGEGGKGNSTYGFSGAIAGGSGGGLSGIFRKSNGVQVLTSDAALALIVAGGGGGADYAGTAASRGGNGNDPVHSGGQPSMQGILDNLDGTTARSYCSSGGGGYNGGTRHSRDSIQGSGATLPYGGEGGSGFTIAGSSNIILLATPDGSPAAPNSSDVDYREHSGRGIAVGGGAIQIDGHGGNGLVVIYWQT